MAVKPPDPSQFSTEAYLRVASLHRDLKKALLAHA